MSLPWKVQNIHAQLKYVSLSFSPRCLAKPDISFYTGFTGIDSNYMNVYGHPPRKLPLVSTEGPLGFDPERDYQGK